MLFPSFLLFDTDLNFELTMRILLSLFILICLGCETIIEVDAPEYDSEPVVTSFFSPDTTWSVTLHQSLGANIRQDVTRQYIADATAKIFQGSNMVDNLSYVGKGEYVSTTGVGPAMGVMYTLEVDFPSKPSIEAISMAPLSIEISDYSIESLPPSSDIPPDFTDGLSRYQLRVVFSDRAGPNYYRIGVYRYGFNWYGREDADPDSVYRRMWFDDYSAGWSCGYENDFVFDPLDGSGAAGGESFCDEEFVVTDRFFDGKSYSWSGTTRDLAIDAGRNELLLIISSLSEDYYEYLKTLERNEFYDPLTEEPFPMYTNVNGGLGVFAGYTNTRLVFPIFQEN